MSSAHRKQRLTGSNPTANLFGESVAISDGRIFVGGYLTEIGGRVVVFGEDRSGAWIEVDEFGASDEDDSDHFTETVAASGSTLAIGSPNDDDFGSNAGSAYVFQRSATPVLEIAGTCPGDLTLALTGATPTGPVFVARSIAEGTSHVPGGGCIGVELDLERPQLLLSFLSDEAGGQSVVRGAPEAACGMYLQVVDGVTCGIGPVIQVP